MSERKPCLKCARAIDEWAKICPFCNWNQDEPLPAVQQAPPAAVANYTPPSEFNLKKKAMFGGIGILVLVAAFGVGMVINQDGAPDKAPLTVEEQQEAEATQRAAGTPRRADTPLIPANEPGGIEQAFTSAPVAAQPGAAPDDYNRTDATAVSATEYAEIARRARAEKERMAAVVDPRSLTGPAYAQGAPVAPVTQRPRRTLAQRAAPAAPVPTAQPPAAAGQPPAADAPPPVTPRASNSARTRPVPIHQPLPRISARGTARLSLMVGADGRVQNVSIERPIAGGTAQLLAAVQNWRFRPATENGEPVAAPYSVEISFDR
jgi:TonB family protein